MQDTQSFDGQSSVMWVSHISVPPCGTPPCSASRMKPKSGVGVKGAGRGGAFCHYLAERRCQNVRLAMAMPKIASVEPPSGTEKPATE